MTRSFALQGLLDIATSEADAAAVSLGNLNRQVLLQEQKLALLIQYRTDYQERLRRAIATGLDAVGLRNFNDFIGRLEQAIAQQRTAIGDARGRAERGRLHWQEKQRKSKAFDTLSQRAGAALVRIENSREQKSQDDFASHAMRRKSCAQR
ncbi:MAG: flagellar export protein FliJ [Burkholderiales bacterium]